MNFSGKFGFASTIWLPASGRRTDTGSLYYVGYYGGYWSASPGSSRAYDLYFYSSGTVAPLYGDYLAYGQSVRCSK